MDTQLQVDQCVGKQGLKLKTTLIDLDSSNLRLKAARTAALSTTLVPAARVALEAEVNLEYLYQEALKAKYNSFTLGGAFLGACGLAQTRFTKFSMISWERPPPDDLGEQPFQWPTQDEDSSFELEVRKTNGVHSAVTVSKGASKGFEYEANWTAQWANFY